MSDETPSHALDEMVRDAVAGQRARGDIPRVQDAAAFIRPILERTERQLERDRLRIKPKAEPGKVRGKVPAALKKEADARLRRRGLSPMDGSWSIERKDPAPSRVIRPSELVRARARIRRLVGNPMFLDLPNWVDALKKALAPIKDRRSATIALREAITEALLRKRIRLLASKPDWAERLKQVNPLAVNGQLGQEPNRLADHALRELIKDSNRVFGDWMKVPDRPAVSLPTLAK